MWPDWAIYWILGNFLKPLATITLPKSSTFLGNFCNVVKMYHFSSEIIFGQLLQTFGNFYLVTLLPNANWEYPPTLRTVKHRLLHSLKSRMGLTWSHCPDWEKVKLVKVEVSIFAQKTGSADLFLFHFLAGSNRRRRRKVLINFASSFYQKRKWRNEKQSFCLTYRERKNDNKRLY